MNYFLENKRQELAASIGCPEKRYLQIREEAEKAAGSLSSLRMRARGYLDVYEASRGACLFAIVAAHGALWASWYLTCASLAAMVFAVTDLKCKMSPLEKYRQFSAYVVALKDINKLVMVESYVLIHTIRELGVEFAIEKGIPEDLAADYARAMIGEKQDVEFLRDIYHRHFLWEQERVVSTKLDEAFAAFTWPFMRGLCQRPWVWFSYFRGGESLNFKSFTDQAERVEKGLIAFDRAIEFGVKRLASITAVRLKIFPGIPVLFRWLPESAILRLRTKQRLLDDDVSEVMQPAIKS